MIHFVASSVEGMTYIWLYILYMVVRFLYFCIILQIMYSYSYVTYSFCYVRSVLGILFHCVFLPIACV